MPPQHSFKIFFTALIIIFSANNAFANNLTVSNVSFGTRNPSANTIEITFNVSWDNSWKTKINHDAVWLTVRLNNPSVLPTEKKLCQLTSSGLNPSSTDVGSNDDLEFYVPSDKVGAFLRPTDYGTFSSVTSTNVTFIIDYSSCGFSSTDTVHASVFGTEMVYIPEGAFYAGDHGSSTASLVEGSSDTDPWYISSESALGVSNPASDGYRYVSAGNTGEDASGTSFTIPSSFPKGYAGFYVMKYEITEGQWVEFVNALSSAARSHRDITDSAHKNTDTVSSRNTISCSGSPLTCTTSRPGRALGYISWMDLSAYLDWAALRPITELEYEKMNRGPLLAVTGEFPWGSTDVTAAATISGSVEDGTETITTTSANAHFGNTTLSGGDTASGAEYQVGPLRVGIFATSASTRETAGAAYYGVMGSAGNIAERVVTIGNSYGRNFTGSHGDGYLVTASGYEGNADLTDWPGIDAITSRGVTGAIGSGYRGGSFADTSARLSTSDRNSAADGATTALSTTGGRGARTYNGN